MPPLPSGARWHCRRRNGAPADAVTAFDRALSLPIGALPPSAVLKRAGTADHTATPSLPIRVGPSGGIKPRSPSSALRGVPTPEGVRGSAIPGSHGTNELARPPRTNRRRPSGNTLKAGLCLPVRLRVPERSHAQHRARCVAPVPTGAHRCPQVLSQHRGSAVETGRAIRAKRSLHGSKCTAAR